MRWIKASERNPKGVTYSEIIWRKIGHVQPLPIRQFYADGEGLYKATPLGGRKDYILWKDLEWLDEALPASLEEEAERLYPYLQASEYLSMNTDNVNRIADYKRSAHITCARQYLSEIERLKAENEKMRKALVEIAAIGQQDEIFDIGGAIFNMTELATEALKTIL